MRKTKIICTMGPSTDDINILREVAKNGMNVARFNFSHGTHAEHKERMDRMKTVREELDLPIAILLARDRKAAPDITDAILSFHLYDST